MTCALTACSHPVVFQVMTFQRRLGVGRLYFFGGSCFAGDVSRSHHPFEIEFQVYQSAMYRSGLSEGFAQREPLKPSGISRLRADQVALQS